MIVGAGDFANCRKGVSDCIDILAGCECPAVLVPGNGESFEELAQACSSFDHLNVLHGNGIEIKGVSFFGIGGGIPITPFGSWSWDFDEETAAQLLNQCPKECVLVSHSPPFGIADLSSSGQHCGSKSVRQSIDDLMPKALVCGHIHDSWETCKTIGSTQVVNAGPKGLWIELVL